MSINQKIFICLLCSIEQMTFILGTTYLVGWCGWDAKWFILTILMVFASSPSVLIKVVEGIGKKKQDSWQGPTGDILSPSKWNNGKGPQ